MVTSTKQAAEGFTGSQYGSGGKANLYGASKESIRATLAAKKGVSAATGEAVGAAKDAAGVQAGAATQAGQTMGSAYGGASAQLGSAYGDAKSALGSAYAAGQQAVGTKHRNALLAARQALAESAMRSTRRGSTMAGNIGATGTLGKQVAATEGMMASQAGAEQSALGIQGAQAVGQLGIQQAAGQGQLGIQGAQAMTAADQTAAGFSAQGMKEAAALKIAATEALFDEAVEQAVVSGLDFTMDEGQKQQAQDDLAMWQTQIATAGQESFESGVNAAFGVLSSFEQPMDPMEQVQYMALVNEAMAGADSNAMPGSGLWNEQQMYSLAASLGPAQALQQLASLGTWIDNLGPEAGASANTNWYNAVLSKMASTGMPLSQLPGMVVYNTEGGGTQLGWADAPPPDNATGSGTLVSNPFTA